MDKPFNEQARSNVLSYLTVLDARVPGAQDLEDWTVIISQMKTMLRVAEAAYRHALEERIK
jgi:hypothetical protein